ncbi:N-acetylmuramoyl-L-alanine amidase [Paenibacillus sp. N3/727]|uniref:N-acetylmuramoyl-L-alanine amidase n=1 Tax=Paenibacillus sp. N3/727 TaxID=2925845 RepID=UPI001F53A383|nr:N-acetylmuramoyl-L-alanine amidase [Paenibacillus sp. N3/727]UNK17037.1 N-acetylmuramoyl-L-alanine amidase [Paenibacillus sp. N3/727]
MTNRISLAVLVALSLALCLPSLQVYADNHIVALTLSPTGSKDGSTQQHNSALQFEDYLHQESGNRGTQQHHPFPHDVILIDVGHGGIDGGTSYGDILEKDINLQISRRLFMLLRSEGYHAVLNRDTDYALSDDNRWHASRSRHMKDLAQRKQLSSEIPTKMVVSIHVNWGKNKSKTGGIVLHQAEGRSSILAESIQRELNILYKSNHHTSVGKPFYLLNRIEVPAVIVETGFISNSHDREKLCSRNGQMGIAEAIVDGIANYLTAL